MDLSICQESDQVSLADLPDPCLLEVLRCCADDPRSICSAARAHSRLHQAAVVALSSIRLTTHRQDMADSLQLYLSRHAQHVSSVSLVDMEEIQSAASKTVRLLQLPKSLHLSSLTCEGVYVQLLPGRGYQGLLGAGAVAALKQLRFKECFNFSQQRRLKSHLVDLATALSNMPQLEHLSVDDTYGNMDVVEALVKLPEQLTCLELAASGLLGYEDEPALMRLQALTRLVDLRLKADRDYSIEATMLSGLQRLTCLQLSTVGNEYDEGDSRVQFDPAALSGKTLLQHLELFNGEITGGAAGVVQLLSQLSELQQLTHLSLRMTLRHDDAEPSSIPAAAYSALTASSKLQCLDISGCWMPPGAWQHVFPSGRQLPQLRVLDIRLPYSDEHQDDPDIFLIYPGSGIHIPKQIAQGAHFSSCCIGLHTLRYGCGCRRCNMLW